MSNIQAVPVITEIELPYTEDEKLLRTARDIRVRMQRTCSPESLAKEIRTLQDASRVQNISKTTLQGLLIEIRTRKDALTLLTGEF